MQTKSRQILAAGADWQALIALGLLVSCAPAVSWEKADNDRRIVRVLEAADISSWRPWKFVGETRYAPVEIDGRRTVKAVSDAAASGYYRKITIDLYATPVLQWSWRVDNSLGEIDETSKAGDDSPARIYVLSAHPVFFWRTRGLAYVWSSVQPRGSHWPSAYTDNQKVIAVRSGERGLGEWHQEQRNVREDFKQYFGKDVRYVDAVAFMTDTDNTGRRAVAYYGNINFAER